MRYYDDHPPYYNPYERDRHHRDQSPIDEIKAGIRYYKSLMAEFNREQEKKEKKKKEEKKPPFNISNLQLATILFFTWPLVPLTQIYAVKILVQTWETAFK